MGKEQKYGERHHKWEAKREALSQQMTTRLSYPKQNTQKVEDNKPQQTYRHVTV